MGDVLIALLPALVVTLIVYGWYAVTVIGVSVGCCIAFEYLIERYILKRNSTVGDLSAVVTGVLLGFNLPATLPVWMIAVGALVAIGVGKLAFGGLGCNPFNPALVGRVFLLISFPVQMTSFATPTHVAPLVESTVQAAATDAVSGPTLLSFVKESLKNGATASELTQKLSFNDMLLGFKAGSVGEIAALALLLGFAYLLVRRVITWHIPVSVLGTMALFAAICWWADPEGYMNPLFHLLSGGALLGAIFMATDYSSSPMTHTGMIIYGIGIGAITMLIRLWGSYPEGMSFAILIMNAVVPLLNKYIHPSRFGVVAAKTR